MTFDPVVNRETGASGRRYHLDMWTSWIRCRCDAHKKQMDSKQLYNPVLQTVRVSWGQFVGVRVAVRGSENQLPAEGMDPQDPQLSSPAEWERSAAIARGTWGQYVAVCSVSNSPLSHNPFATLSNKVWEVYFSFVRSPLLLTMFPCIVEYVLCGYTTDFVCLNFGIMGQDLPYEGHNSLQLPKAVV